MTASGIRPFDLSLDAVSLEVPDGASGGMRPIFSSYSFRLPQGAHIGVRGPSGSGKTTFLKLLSGIALPTEGSVRWGATELSRLPEAARDRWRGEHCGFLFQDFRLFDDLTALENVLLPVTFRRRVSNADREAARALLVERGIRPDDRAGSLSRGEMQRTALARVLMGRPAVILADEPTASLDDERGEAAVRDLIRSAEALSATLVLVSHNESVLAMLPRTVSIRGGRLSELPELPDHPETPAGAPASGVRGFATPEAAS